MISLKKKIDTWVFDLDNTLYSAESGIFQQVHELMGKFVSNKLKIDLDSAKKLQSKYFIKHGTTLKGLMDNHGVEPDEFLDYVHKLDYSIIHPNNDLNKEISKLQGRKIIYTNANRQHVNEILLRLDLTNIFDEIFDIKMANYIPKPEINAYKDFIKRFNINPKTTIMFDDIAKNLVPAKNVGFKSVWIDLGIENISDDIKNSKRFLDFETKDLSKFLYEINREGQ
tara:strand:+ start:487 stop:1164 length:678 start_codon:yes stop_codon:yes gene_type:complete